MPDSSSQIPVFIGGFRSGTTLLVNLLGMHSGLSAWFETKELCEALRWQRVLADPASLDSEAALLTPGQPQGFSADAVHQRMLHHVRQTRHRIDGTRRSGKGGHERYPLGNDQVLYSLDEAEAALLRWRDEVGGQPDAGTVGAATATLIRDLGRRQCAAGNRAHWINKTPEISRFAAELRTILGPCRVINLIRNGLEVVASAMELHWGDAADLSYKWQGLILETRSAMAGHEQDLLELRYEALVESPVVELDRVFAFCGLATEAADIVSCFCGEFGDAAFDRSRSSERSGPDATTLAQFTRVAGALQRELGYPL